LTARSEFLLCGDSEYFLSLRGEDMIATIFAVIYFNKSRDGAKEYDKFTFAHLRSKHQMARLFF
jgi:hypothetical protein